MCLLAKKREKRFQSHSSKCSDNSHQLINSFLGLSINRRKQNMLSLEREVLAVSTCYYKMVIRKQSQVLKEVLDPYIYQMSF